jgi:NTP pyrophosphatase (non-canonical NTP hydrolase)
MKNYNDWVMPEMSNEDLRTDINELVMLCHTRSRDAGWYHDAITGMRLERNVGEMLCLVHSEISEAMEGYRKDLMDDKLPHRQMIEVELADALIRIADLSGFLGLDLGGATAEKLEYNLNREDHKIENRAIDGGKKF